jgi:hypothetical protein
MSPATAIGVANPEHQNNYQHGGKWRCVNEEQVFLQLLYRRIPMVYRAEVKNEWCYTSTPPYAFMEGTGAASHLPFTKGL